MPGQLYRVQFQTTGWVGAPALSTFYFTPEVEDGTQDGAEECAARVRAFFTANNADNFYGPPWVGSLVQDVPLFNVETGTIIRMYDANDSAPLTATAEIELGPANAMLVLRYTTAGIVNGKRVAGRSYIGPGSAAWSNDGSPSSAAKANLQTNADSTLDVMIGLAVNQAVWSRPVDTGPNARVGSAHQVTGYSVSSAFGQLKSRRQ